MSWMHLLCRTYDVVSRQGAFCEPGHPLVPIGFVEKNADICVMLDNLGNFSGAFALTRENSEAICVPTTPEAEGRTSAAEAYPLCDQLKYVAGDCPGRENCFAAYISHLKEWAETPGAPAVLAVLLAYLQKKRLVQDLRSGGVIEKVEKAEKLFVCFRIQSSQAEEERLWMRDDVRTSWLERSAGLMGESKLCFVEGRLAPVMENHPKLLGNGKLISSQDTGTVFQYKGRFTAPDEAVTVSYDASVKAHNTLSWLLKRQGFTRYGMYAVAWSTDGMYRELPVSDDGLSELNDIDDAEPDTFEAYGKALRTALYGKKGDPLLNTSQDEVAVLVMQAATTGRVSIVYNQEMPGDEYVKRLQSWYETCSWGFTRFRDGGEKPIRGISSPTPMEIAQVVMGKQETDIARKDKDGTKGASKWMRELKLRLLHCMVDGAGLPRDLEQSAFHRVSAPQGFMDERGRWQAYAWQTALSTYCALLRKQQLDHKEEVMDVKLDETCRDRSYLYGRLLALVDHAEMQAMGQDNYRQTNAFRYMQMFRQRPFDTWTNLHSLVQPYFRKLGVRAEWYKKQISEVMVLFEEGQFEARKSLDGRFLQGYYCQRQALFTKKDKDASDALAANPK